MRVYKQIEILTLGPNSEGSHANKKLSIVLGKDYKTLATASYLETETHSYCDLTFIGKYNTHVVRI